MIPHINKGVPWVEKHRPSNMTDIVLDKINQKILSNILVNNYFPNLLFHGPPGTGKTTTIINIVNEYQRNNGDLHKGLMIHLNASDDRGIDTIRNQISQFVGTQGLFSQGLKFVILDEVDYMTKTAQQALRCLLNSHKGNVRFCLICNYISRIDESLQNDFIRLRFNQLPERNIIDFLSVIVEKENLNLTPDILGSIQQLYKSDIRSMINCLQSQQNATNMYPIITRDVWDDLMKTLSKTSLEPTLIKNASETNAIYDLITNIAEVYNINYNTIIKQFLYHIVRNYPTLLTEEFLVAVDYLMHMRDGIPEFNVMYLISVMSIIIV